ncbi:MAG: sulfotransferase family protein [Xanthomonadales bacterium]|nr:sulfotransferase family protein [Xanthomonadales bacterium]
MALQKPRATWNHPLLGADPGTLVRLAAANRVPPAMWPRLAAFFGAALARAPLSLAERAWTGMRADPLEGAQAPVFILGHWRSGTTHLFNLMSRDPRFAWPDPIATGLPWDFLLLGRALRPLLKRALPESRLIDNVEVNPDSPQEDEIALASMQDLSYYHALYFPKKLVEHFERGAFLDNDDVPPAALRRRARRLRHYSRKLLLNMPGDTLLVKNPIYTGQVAWLRSLWPDARFVHIHRNPYVVFDSTRNFYRKLLPAYALQPFDAEAAEPVILDAYPRMLERLYADTEDLPDDRFIEIAYDDLDKKPLECLEDIYDQLGIGDFERQAPRFSAYLESIRGYRKNPHRFDPATLDKVDAAWGPWLKRWGYSRPEAAAASSGTPSAG